MSAIPAPSLRLPRLNVPVAIFAVVMALVTIGLLAVYSASATLAGWEERMALQKSLGMVPEHVGHHGASYLKKQLMWATLGVGGLFFFYFYDYRRLKKHGFWIMAGSFLACCLVWAPGLGVQSRGAHRWINVGVGTLQPSEFAKIGLIIYMAKMLDDRRRYIKSFFSGVLPAMIVTAAFGIVIVLEPDFGAAAVLGLTIFGMWICGEMRWFHLIGLVSATIPAAIVAFLTKPYRMLRLMAFLNPDDPEMRMGAGFQLYQSLIAVGSGGVTGLGIGKSMQKYHYLFAGHTDFIFAILGEETGLVGSALVVTLYMILVLLGWKVALNTPDLFGSLLATGITLLVFLGATINMCVVLGLLPTKGLVLPFMSYGGSSLLAILMAMGILMNIARVQRELGEPD